MPRLQTAFKSASHECGGKVEVSPGIGDNSGGVEMCNIAMLAEDSGYSAESIRQQMGQCRGDLGLTTFVVG